MQGQPQDYDGEALTSSKDEALATQLDTPKELPKEPYGDINPRDRR